MTDNLILVEICLFVHGGKSRIGQALSFFVCIVNLIAQALSSEFSFRL